VRELISNGSDDLHPFGFYASAFGRLSVALSFEQSFDNQYLVSDKPDHQRGQFRKFLGDFYSQRVLLVDLSFVG
jgi:hypothetical protein